MRIGEVNLLRQVGRFEADALADGAAVRRFLAEQDFEHRGLACAVRAEQRDALAVTDVERYVM